MKSILSFLERRKLFILPLAGVSIFLLLATRYSNQDGSSWPTSLRSSTSTTLSTSEGSSDVVSFAFITYGLDSAKEAAVTVKSLLMHISRPLEIHILASDDAATYLEARLALVHRPAHNVKVVFYVRPEHDLAARIDREGQMWSIHHSYVGGLMKLFLHEALPPSVHRILFADTDGLFIVDPALLWDQIFPQFSPTTMLAFPYHPEAPLDDAWHGATRICSCIMAADLDRMREVRFMGSRYYPDEADSTGKVVRPVGSAIWKGTYTTGESGKIEDNVGGDQGFFYPIKLVHPEMFMDLPLSWEITSCTRTFFEIGLDISDGRDDTTEAEAIAVSKGHTGNPEEEKSLIVPSFLHFNCKDVDNIFVWPGWEDPSDDWAKRWGPTVLHYARYKWIWLNRAPKGTTTMSVSRAKDLRFADEIWFEQHGMPDPPRHERPKNDGLHPL